MQQPNLEIMTFIEQQILPRYNAFGKSHGLGHVQRVIKNSLALAAATGADVNMVYVIAAYHDLGMEGPRAIHHITSGKILMADGRLKKWFSPEQLKIMKEAVEDHRASCSRTPRSIYGKIVTPLLPSAIISPSRAMTAPKGPPPLRTLLMESSIALCINSSFVIVFLTL